MQRKPLKVLIVGAGTGGLCLAQGLKLEGVEVEVFERDHAASEGLQGYRLSLNSWGIQALERCLPPAVYAQLLHASGKPSKGLTFLDERLERLLGLDFTQPDGSAVEHELPVSRLALRRTLLEGLDGSVHFAKKFIAYEEAGQERVTARFDDGSTATGDVLIGADGASSRMRSLLLPAARRVETGIVAVTGKFPLDGTARSSIPPAVLRGPTLILGPRGCFMFANAVEYDASRTAGLAAEDREEYVMWGFSAARGKFGRGVDIESLQGRELKGAVTALMRGFSPVLRSMVEAADEGSVTAFSVKSSLPVAPWTTRNVTLLGDALHNMTPFRGIGANTALRDAAALRITLAAVSSGDCALLPGLARYEREMIAYGFDAVRTSLQDMERFHSDSRLRRTLTRTTFKTVDRLSPTLRSAFLGRESRA